MAEEELGQQEQQAERRRKLMEDQKRVTDIRANRPKEYTQQLSDDDDIARGQEIGLERAENIYGMSTKEIGTEVQDITARRRAALDGNDPATDSLRRGKNAQIREARSQGATSGQEAQINRQAAQDIGQQEFKSQNEALGEYQDLIGNILGGTTETELGFAQLEKAGEDTRYDRSKDDSGMSVICTELHAQGYMSDEMYEKDTEHGKTVRANDILVYIGYIVVASPIVWLMRKSPVFTKLISYPALEWAKDMAGEKSLTGKTINKICTPICRVIGAAVSKLNQLGVIYG